MSNQILDELNVDRGSVQLQGVPKNYKALIICESKSFSDILKWAYAEFPFVEYKSSGGNTIKFEDNNSIRLFDPKGKKDWCTNYFSGAQFCTIILDSSCYWDKGHKPTFEGGMGFATQYMMTRLRSKEHRTRFVMLYS